MGGSTALTSADTRGNRLLSSNVGSLTNAPTTTTTTTQQLYAPPRHLGHILSHPHGLLQETTGGAQ